MDEKIVLEPSDPHINRSVSAGRFDWCIVDAWPPPTRLWPSSRNLAKVGWAAALRAGQFRDKRRDV
eukprot:COSAG02_NODE_2235_length_9420_cov_27.032722_5_plen_66_part_00